MIQHQRRLPLLTILLTFLTALSYSAPIVVSGGPDNDYESWITRLRDGRLIVIFDRNPDWASGNLFVVFSTNDGNSWSTPVPIIADPGDQATLSFVQLPNDTIRLWYASNETGTYGIYTAWSLDGITWVKQGRINLGWSASDMHYDPTVILEPDSSLTMSYRGPGGAFIAHCPYQSTWDTLKTLCAPSGNRPRIMKHANGTYLLAYQRRSGSSSANIDVFIRTSLDRITWSDSIRLTTNMNSHDAFPVQAPDGAYLVYYGKYVYPAYNLKRRRSYDAVNWLSEETVTSDTVYNLQPHLFVENSNIYLIWAHEINYETDNDVYFEKTPYLNITESKMNDRRRRSIVITPNPCCRFFTINHPGIPEDIREITLYNSSGQKILEVPPALPFVTADASGLQAGIYFAELKTSEGRLIGKIVVNR